MRITVLFFATLRDLVGARDIRIELDEAENNIEALRRELATRYPAAAENLGRRPRRHQRRIRL